MIRYSLVCDRAHDFESWFSSIEAFEEQQRRGLLDCPVCGSGKVDRAIMSPGIAGRREPDASPTGPSQPVTLVSNQDRALRDMVRTFRQQVMAQTEDVGRAFADEARKIHYGEAEARSIRGEASPDDARSLVEEGIAFQPLPTLPDDRN